MRERVRVRCLGALGPGIPWDPRSRGRPEKTAYGISGLFLAKSWLKLAKRQVSWLTGHCLASRLPRSLMGTSGGRYAFASAEEAGFPITVAGPRGNCTHFPFTPFGAPQSHFRDQTQNSHIPSTFGICQRKAVISSQSPVASFLTPDS